MCSKTPNENRIDDKFLGKMKHVLTMAHVILDGLCHDKQL